MCSGWWLSGVCLVVLRNRLKPFLKDLMRFFHSSTYSISMPKSWRWETLIKKNPLSPMYRAASKICVHLSHTKAYLNVIALHNKMHWYPDICANALTNALYIPKLSESKDILFKYCCIYSVINHVFMCSRWCCVGCKK